MLAEVESRNIIDRAITEQVEAHMLRLPQADCPVVHHFGPGVYIREVTLPAGTIAIGHEQRHEHLNIMLSGVVSIIGDDGMPKTLRAPLIFVGKPGRKIGYIIETCVWQNVYPNVDDERNIDTLEAKWLDKSATWKSFDESARKLAYSSRQEDRDDFAKVIRRAGFSQEQVRAQSEDKSDQMEMPDGFAPKFTLRESLIDGVGVFLSSPAEAGEIIAPARIGGLRTPAGRYTNHSRNPNARFMKDDCGDIWLVAARRINGCCGGNQGDEVTVDYRQALSLSGIYIGEEKL